MPKREVQIRRTEEKIIITAPYNQTFVEFAREYAGKFDRFSKAWVFDIRDEAEVLEACYTAYGEDGIRYNKCDIQITFTALFSVLQDGITFCGRKVASATGRDSGAKIGSGIVVKSGKFDSGGSMKNWRTRAEEGTQIIMRDVSRPLLDIEMAKLNELNESGEEHGIVIEIIGSQNDLMAEREKLLARLAEIEKELEAK